MAEKRVEKSLYYHGLKEQKKLDVSRLKYFSILLSVIGVAVLLVAAQGAQAPLMHVSEVTGNYMMNYAVVRLSGTVASVPYVSTTGGKITLTFAINDGTGQIDVRVYSPVADRMIERGVIPFPGDNVTAEVQLRVRETYTYAMLQYLEGLKFNRKLYSENPPTVKELTENMSNTYVAVQGIVTEVSNVSSGYLLTVDTGVAPVTVLIPRVLLLKGNVSVKVGDTVYAPGVVYLYKGTSPEIVVRSLEQFNVTPIESAPLVPLAEAPGYVGMVMSVQGNLSGISYENGRYVLTLTDGTNYLDVLLPREVLAKLNPFEVGSGSLIKAAGKMGDDGRLVGAYLKAVKPVKTEFLPVGVLSPDMKGTIVAVKANVEDIQKVGSNLKLVVSDSTGRIDVFIPSATLRELSNETLAGLKKGLGVEVAGYLDEYRGSPEIVVYTGDGIKALGRPVSPSEIQLPRVTASELENYVGKLVDFEGSLQGLSYANGTYYLKVDGISVSLPRSVLLNLNPLEAGNGSVVVVRALVKAPDYLRGENLTVETALPPIQLRADQVTPDMAGQIVAVVGRVTGVANISGNLKITLGGLTVFVPRSTADELSYVPQKGDLVEVGGYVELYRGEPEIVVFHPEAIAKVREEVVQGTVAEFQSSVKPMLLTVTWDSISYEDGKYYLKVHDDTGSVSLTAERSLLPNPLEVATGSTLKVVADPLSGSITSLEVVKPVPPSLFKTGQVTLDLRGKVIALNATVVKATVIRSNLKLTIDDGSGSIDVFIPGGADLTISEGTVVEVAGYVDEYAGKPELVVYNTSAVRTFKAKPSTREATVSQLSSLSGQANLTVIWDAITYESGYKITVHDDTGSATLSISRELLPNPLEAGTGSKIRITYDADSKKVVALTVIEAKPSPVLATGDVTLTYQGKTVIVEGTITDVYEGKSFIKLTVDDGSGELVIFIPKSVAGDLTFSEGQTIRVAGYVTEYKGTVEVVPYTQDAIQVR
jgi:DNA/RNA endonuclease YhcR with UshA esterase domain